MSLSLQERAKAMYPEMITLEYLIFGGECLNVLQRIEGQDVLLFIGNNQVGKSTLINYLEGHSLIAYRNVNKNFEICNFGISGPSIRPSSDPEKNIESSESSSGMIVELPNFDRTGNATYLANVFFMKEILRCAKTLRVVLVVDINDLLNDRIPKVIKFLGDVDSLLPQCVSIRNSCALIFNKDSNNTRLSLVNHLIYEQIITNDYVHPDIRMFADHFLRYKKITIITTPIFIDHINTNDLGDIKKSVDSLVKWPTNTRHMIKKINNNAKKFIDNVFPFLTDEEDVDDVLSIIEETYLEYLQDYEINSSMKQGELKQIKSEITFVLCQIKAIDCPNTTIEEFIKTATQMVEIDDVEDVSVTFVRLKYVDFQDWILRGKARITLTNKMQDIIKNILPRLILVLNIIDEAMVNLTNDREAMEVDQPLTPPPTPQKQEHNKIVPKKLKKSKAKRRKLSME